MFDWPLSTPVVFIDQFKGILQENCSKTFYKMPGKTAGGFLQVQEKNELSHEYSTLSCGHF